MILRSAPPVPTRLLRVGALPVAVYDSNEALGRAAAAAAATIILGLARRQPTVRLLLGTGNSQLSFIGALTREHALPWDQIECFHMDEYLGISDEHPASFRRWMRERVVETVRPRQFHFVQGDAADPEAEARRYAALLDERPLDLTCLGIGENGHIAFNDPPFADFADPQSVKIISLAEKSRHQQVGEGHFPTLADVPRRALTVTVPLLLSARHVLAIVPEGRKAAAVRAALHGPVTPDCPASILREKAHARLFLDEDSASALDVVDASERGRPSPAQKPAALDAIVRQGFVPIFVNDTLDSRRLVEAAVAAGCQAIEYSCRRTDARTIVPWIRREFPDLTVMVATLMDGPNVEACLRRSRDGFLGVDEAVQLGAGALVSFMRFRPETYARYARHCVMVPGVANQNEALDQMELGADLIKTTVHTVGGVDFVTKTGPVTHHCIPFFISGGVTAANLETYLQAGVAVTAAGFDVLLGAARPEGPELTRLAAEAIRRMKDAVHAAREKHQPALAAAIREGTPNLLASGRWFHSASPPLPPP